MCPLLPVFQRSLYALTTHSKSEWSAIRRSTWSEVTRQAIREKIKQLELMAELAADSQLTNEDVDELANQINESARRRLEKEVE